MNTFETEQFLEECWLDCSEQLGLDEESIKEFKSEALQTLYYDGNSGTTCWKYFVWVKTFDALDELFRKPQNPEA
jgi:hypothetical protein